MSLHQHDSATDSAPTALDVKQRLRSQPKLSGSDRRVQQLRPPVANGWTTIADIAAQLDSLPRSAGDDPHFAVTIPALELADLLKKLSSQPVIEQAKGILMGYYGLDADAAFETLRRWSQANNIKLRDLARLLTDDVTHHSSARQPPHKLVEGWTEHRTLPAS